MTPKVEILKKESMPEGPTMMRLIVVLLAFIVLFQIVSAWQHRDGSVNPEKAVADIRALLAQTPGEADLSWALDKRNAELEASLAVNAGLVARNRQLEEALAKVQDVIDSQPDHQTSGIFQEDHSHCTHARTTYAIGRSAFDHSSCHHARTDRADSPPYGWYLVR